MNRFLYSFADELVKTGGVFKSVGKFVTKHPLVALTAAGTAAATGASAANAYKEGLAGGDKPRYLSAGVDPVTREATTSPAAYTNYHQLIEHKPTRREEWELSRWYDPNKFKR